MKDREQGVSAASRETPAPAQPRASHCTPAPETPGPPGPCGTELLAHLVLKHLLHVALKYLACASCFNLRFHHTLTSSVAQGSHLGLVIVFFLIVIISSSCSETSGPCGTKIPHPSGPCGTEQLAHLVLKHLVHLALKVPQGQDNSHQIPAHCHTSDTAQPRCLRCLQREPPHGQAQDAWCDLCWTSPTQLLLSLQPPAPNKHLCPAGVSEGPRPSCAPTAAV